MALARSGAKPTTSKGNPSPSGGGTLSVTTNRSTGAPRRSSSAEPANNPWLAATVISGSQPASIRASMAAHVVNYDRLAAPDLTRYASHAHVRSADAGLVYHCYGQLQRFGIPFGKLRCSHVGRHDHAVRVSIGPNGFYEHRHSAQMLQKDAEEPPSMASVCTSTATTRLSRLPLSSRLATSRAPTASHPLALRSCRAQPK